MIDYYGTISVSETPATLTEAMNGRQEKSRVKRIQFKQVCLWQKQLVQINKMNLVEKGV